LQNFVGFIAVGKKLNFFKKLHKVQPIVEQLWKISAKPHTNKCKYIKVYADLNILIDKTTRV